MIEKIIGILNKRYGRYAELLAHQQGTAEEICQLFELPEGEPYAQFPKKYRIISPTTESYKG